MNSAFTIKAPISNTKINSTKTNTAQTNEVDTSRDRFIYSRFISNKFLSGEYTDPQIIQALINPIYKGNDLVLENGNYARNSNNEFINKNDLPKAIKITDKDLEFLEKLAIFFNPGSASAEESTLGLSQAINLINFGSVTNPQVIEAFENPIYNSSGELLLKDGFITAKNKNLNTSIKREDLEFINQSFSPTKVKLAKFVLESNNAAQLKSEESRRKLSEKRAALKIIINSESTASYLADSPREENLLQKISELIKEDKDFKQLIEKFITDGNAIALDKYAQSLKNNPESSSNEKAETLEELSLFFKEIKTILIVAKSIVDTEDPVDVEAKFEQKKSQFNLNKEVESDLEKLVSNYKTAKIIEESTNKIKTSEALELAAKVQDQPEIYEAILETIYRKELKYYRESLQQSLVEEAGKDELNFDKSERLLNKKFEGRPEISSFDYQSEITKLKDEFSELRELFIQYRVAQEASTLKNIFETTDLNLIRTKAPKIAELNKFNAQIGKKLLEILQNNSQDTNLLDQLIPQINSQLEAQINQEYIESNLGGNQEAFLYIQNNYLRSFHALVETMRSDPSSQAKMNSYLDTQNGTRPKSLYEQRLSQLKKQRDLSPVEAEYFKSVERLSVFNPYLVAAFNTNPKLVSTVANEVLELKSTETQAKLEDKGYFPLIQVGTGPAGTIALGEVTRNNPNLSKQILVIDSGSKVGGPFAVPNGAAWSLNSANAKSASVRNLTDLPENTEEAKTVRGNTGSSLRWFPGERLKEKPDIRYGDINPIVDYSVMLSEINDQDYANNWDLQNLIAVQNALLVENLSLETQLVKIEPNLDPNLAGDKVVTLRIKQGEDSKEIQIRTDALFIAGGLGEANYGFNLDCSQASQNLLGQEQKNSKEFPKLSTTLEAFKALVDENDQKEFEEDSTLIIYGAGNSLDTLLEFFSRQFSDNTNQSIKNIKKIYVVADKDFNARPRYAKIKDIFPRNSNPNFVEIINSRVCDVDTLKENDDKELVVFDKDFELISNLQGDPIKGNYVIAATGFTSNLDGILEGYSEKLAESDDNQALASIELRSPFTLNGDSKVKIAEELSADPNIVILGTNSNAFFTEEAKLAQLPQLAREALERNGAENAVAIGFRGPDTQTTVKTWLEQREVNIPSENLKFQAEKQVDINLSPSTRFNSLVKDIDLDSGINFEPNNKSNNENSILLNTKLYSILGSSIKIIDGSKNNTLAQNFNGEINFQIVIDPDNQILQLSIDKEIGFIDKAGRAIYDSADILPEPVYDQIAESIKDPIFQKYVLNYCSSSPNLSRQEKPIIQAQLAFKRGGVDPRRSFIG